jgi:hypothetical protein
MIHLMSVLPLAMTCAVTRARNANGLQVCSPVQSGFDFTTYDYDVSFENGSVNAKFIQNGILEMELLQHKQILNTPIPAWWLIMMYVWSRVDNVRKIHHVRK